MYRSRLSLGAEDGGVSVVVIEFEGVVFTVAKRVRVIMDWWRV